MNTANKFERLNTLHDQLDLLEQVLRGKIASGNFELSPTVLSSIKIFAQSAIETAEAF